MNLGDGGETAGLFVSLRVGESRVGFTAKEKIHGLCTDMPSLPVALSPERKAVMSVGRKTLYELLVHCCLSCLSIHHFEESDSKPQIM